MSFLFTHRLIRGGSNFSGKRPEAAVGVEGSTMWCTQIGNPTVEFPPTLDRVLTNASVSCHMIFFKSAIKRAGPVTALLNFSNRRRICMEDSTQLAEIPKNTCFCRKSFVLTSAYNNHLRKCPSTKRRVSSGLARAKELWEAKKHQKTVELSLHLSTPQHELTGLLVLLCQFF